MSKEILDQFNSAAKKVSPKNMNNIDRVADLYQRMIEEYPQDLVEKPGVL